jgi:glutamate--cysteine ligase
MTGLAPKFHLPEGVASPDEAISSPAQFPTYFEAGSKSPGVELLGVEYERLPLRADGTVAPYLCDEGPCVGELIEFLAEATDFERQVVEGHLLGLAGQRSAVHLEPGAQPELALAPKTRARDVAVSLTTWRGMLQEAARETGVHVVALGMQPVTPVPDIPWVPKERYRIMSAHLGARGRLAHHMMKASAGVQLNVDYSDQAGAAEIMAASLAASPLVNALCSNSPLEAGKPSGYASRRAEIWLETDPERYDLLPWVLDEGFSYEAYARWALEASVMFVVRGDGEGGEKWVSVGDKSFARFLDDPGELGPATWTDWHLHLTTLFPEVRIKQHVEVRGADSCSIELVTAITALWRGLLYDGQARRGAMTLLDGLDAAARAAMHAGAGREGLAYRAGDATVQERSLALLEMAAAGLDRLAVRDGEESESTLLDPLREVAESGRTPADRLLDDWQARGTAALLDCL